METLEASSKMELSDRVKNLKPSSTLAVSARVKALKAQGVDVIGFGAGEPDFDTPEHIKLVAIRAIEEGMTGYAPVPGDMATREVIAKKFRDENGIDCQAKDIVISTGAKQSLYLALQCLIDEGKGHEVILPAPSWVSYFSMAQLAGGTVVEIESSIDNDFKITPAQLEAAITPNSRAIVLNNPSNPCGTMYTEQDLRDLADVLAKHDHVTIISDEIYEKLVFGEVEPFSIGSLPQVASRTITINGLSKGYAMTGWRVGYACAPGNGDGAMAKAMAKLQGQMTT
ncbi:MAG: pyridoxal phosphate-dependent aminotransferase, partial [Planctomycetota bacterium]|nr:pyridoxal phosphate-dependent aminotransferase [Planctomycetota bacterium]